MPIQFRCNNCGQKLSISRKKAGSEVTCPECVHRVRVPTIEEALEKAKERKKEKARLAAEQAAAQTPSPSAEQKEVAEPESDVILTEGDDSNLRLQIERPAELPPPNLMDPQAWEHHPNPWLHEEDEDEDFQLAAPGLEESGLDMTPMVDVTFLLLIFFMVTASFSTQKSLETAPPEPEDEGASQSVVIEDIEEESVVVEIDGEDNIRVDDVPVSGFGELKDVLQAKIANEGKTEMLIEADVKSRHGTVVAVTDAGLEVQMQRIRRSSKKNDD